MKCWQQRLDDLKSSTVMSAFIDCDTMAVEQRLNNNRNNINNNRTIRKPDKDEKVFEADEKVIKMTVIYKVERNIGVKREIGILH